jgi:hypothetical protein
MKLPLADQLELDTIRANRSPISQLPYLGPHIKITKPPGGLASVSGGLASVSGGLASVSLVDTPACPRPNTPACPRPHQGTAFPSVSIRVHPRPKCP